MLSESLRADARGNADLKHWVHPFRHAVSVGSDDNIAQLSRKVKGMAVTDIWKNLIDGRNTVLLRNAKCLSGKTPL